MAVTTAVEISKLDSRRVRATRHILVEYQTARDIATNARV
jgi:hypothetical protein